MCKLMWCTGYSSSFNSSLIGVGTDLIHLPMTLIRYITDVVPGTGKRHTIVKPYRLRPDHDWGRSIASYDVVIFFAEDDGFVPPLDVFPAVANQARFLWPIEPDNTAPKPGFPPPDSAFPRYPALAISAAHPELCPGFIDYNLPPLKRIAPEARAANIIPWWPRIPIDLYRQMMESAGGASWNASRSNTRTALGDGIQVRYYRQLVHVLSHITILPLSWYQHSQSHSTHSHFTFTHTHTLRAIIFAIIITRYPARVWLAAI